MPNCENNFFDQFEELPVWKQLNGKLICEDIKTGRILSTMSQPTLPDGSFINFFTPYKAILVKNTSFYTDKIPSYILNSDIKNKNNTKTTLKKGTNIYVGMKPNGLFFLAFSDKQMASIGDDINLSNFSFVLPKPVQTILKIKI